MVSKINTCNTIKIGSEIFGKGNKGNVKSMLAVIFTRLDANVESIFSSVPFVRINATSVTRLDAKFELTLSISLVIRLDANVESIFSSTSFVRIDASSVTRPSAEVEQTLSIASFIKIDANVESIFLVTLDGWVNVKMLYM